MGEQKRFAERARRYFGDGTLSEMVVLYGDRRATVRGCRKMLSYDPKEIRFALRARSVRLRGNDLRCVSFARGSATVEGILTAVEFCAEREEQR